MTSELYQEIVLESSFPFMAAAFNFDCTLKQDNDTKHKSKLMRDLFSENDIDWVKTFYVINIFAFPEIKFKKIKRLLDLLIPQI